MDKIKLIIAFFAGAAVGATIGSIATKKIVQKNADEQVDSVREHYMKKEKEIVKDIPNEEPKKENNTIVEERPNDDVKTIIKREYINYNDYSKTYGAEEEKTLAPQEKPYKPYVIEEAAYIETNLNYTKEVMSYYPEDDVLVDVDDEPIVNPESLVGFGLKEKFEYEDGVDEIYIRNDNLSRDFDIVCREGRFFYSENDI